MNGEAEQVERGRGRPRDKEKDSAIRDAFWAVLAQRGYDGLTFEAVAEAAGCSRATLYRRFSSKLELVATALDETSRAIEPDLPDDIDPRLALDAHVAGTVTYMSSGRGPAVLSMSEAAARLPELRRVTDAYKSQEREFYYAQFRRLVPGVDEQRMSFAFDSYVGMMIYNVAIEGRRIAQTERDLIIDSLLYILRHPAP